MATDFTIQRYRVIGVSALTGARTKSELFEDRARAERLFETIKADPNVESGVLSIENEDGRRTVIDRFGDEA